MGDRYYLRLNCAYCGQPNPPEDKDVFDDGVYYAESSEITTFKCEYCKKENGISQSFIAVKLKKGE